MTDKDPKDMTVSELLREADSNPCSMCHLVMTGDESCATTGCASWAYRLADKIDAELVQARKDGFDDFKTADWYYSADANDWPKPRDDESLHEYISRCFIPRPRFEDGEPVQFGELVSSNLFGAVKVSAIEFTEDGTHVKDEPDGDWSTSLEVTTSRLKRPAPEVLGADGKPIKVGETVYPIDGEWLRIPLEVSGIESPASVKVYLSAGKSWTTFHADRLTHTPPDTQERIDADALKSCVEYWDCDDFSCGKCPALIDGKKPVEFYELDPIHGSCHEAQKLDLLRRQRELDKRTGGAE